MQAAAVRAGGAVTGQEKCGLASDCPAAIRLVCGQAGVRAVNVNSTAATA